MNFSWMDYLDLAKDLIPRGRNTPLAEAFFRASVSRAYYCIYWVARNRLEAKGQIISKPDSHLELVKQYKISGIAKENQVGRNLEKIRAQRLVADYEADREIDENFANTIVRLADRTLSQLKSLN